MEHKNLSEAISKNLQIIKKESLSNDNENLSDPIDNPNDLLSELPKIPSSKSEFEYCANRSFFDEIYFKNSKLITM